MSDQLLTRSTLVLRENKLPLSFWPLPIWNGQDVVKALCLSVIKPVIMGNNPYIARSPTTEISVPLVVCLNQPYAGKLKENKPVRFTLVHLFTRDMGCCAYCAKAVQMRYPHQHDTATHDHIMPRSRGGNDTWENAALACAACNTFKANRTPEEAGMRLLINPWAPLPAEMMRLMLYRHPLEVPAWHEFLQVPDTPRTDATLTALAT